jgi:hypothetical protein
MKAVPLDKCWKKNNDYDHKGVVFTNVKKEEKETPSR